MTKTCISCSEVHAVEFFNNDRTRPDGKDPRCKNCTRAACKRVFEKYKPKHLALKARWKAENSDYNKAMNARYRKENPHISRANTSEYRARLKRATPSWVKKEDLEFVRSLCPPGFHVDHVHPLKGKNLCGLNVPWNLQFLPPEEHWRKGTKVPVAQEAYSHL